MRPFRLISPSRMAQVEERVSRAAEAWCKDWMPAPAALLVRCRAADTAAAKNGYFWFHCGELSGGPSLGIDDMSLSKLVELLSSSRIKGAPPSSLRSWGYLALAGLLQSCTNVRGALQALPDIDATLFRTGSGAVVAEIDFAGISLLIVLDAAAVDGLLPSAQVRPIDKGGLSRRGALLSEVGVHLEVCLSPTSIEVGDLSSLQVGDTLQLDHRTASPVLLFSDGGVELGRAHLGRRGASRAVRLSKISDSKAKHV